MEAKTILKGDQIVEGDEVKEGDAQETAQPLDPIPCEGLSPEDARAVRELAAELLSFSPIPLARLSRRESSL